MIDPKTFLKLPINFNNTCFIYPPTINEVIGNDNFMLYKNIILKEKDEIKEELQKKNIELDLSPLQWVIYLFKDNENLVRQAFHFFIKEEINILPNYNMIILGNLKDELRNIQNINDLRKLTDENFLDFQNQVRIALGDDVVEEFIPNPNEDPRVQAIKKKAFYRDRIKRKKGNTNGTKISMTGSLACLCCMDFGLNPLNIGEISYGSIRTLMRYYQEKRKYNTDIRSLLSFGLKKKNINPVDWIRDIND